MKTRKLFARMALLSLCAIGSLKAQTRYNLSEMQAERLDRGVVAVRVSADSVLVSWRYLPADPIDQRFAVYRNGKRLGETGSRQSTTWMDCYPATAQGKPAKKATYEVRPVSPDGKEQKQPDARWTLPTDAPIGYIDIPLQRPADELDANGKPVTYTANDATAADLDGDGQLEIVLKWDPSNSKDNSQSGVTNSTYMDAYKLTGKHLWRIDLGKNIRSGAHYTPFLVADFDGDGCAELAMRTSDGSRDARGKVIGDPQADWRVGMETRGDREYYAPGQTNEQFRKDQYGKRGGHITDGPDYLTVFDGRTGAERVTVDYIPQRGDPKSWGDNYSNRSDRFLACVAYLDGVRPSIVMWRGYYTRMVVAAWDFDGRQLTRRWVFDSDQEDRIYHGQGNHNLRVADVDGDGRDEITCGSCCIDHDGTGLYSLGMGHGDAMHLTAFYPDSDRLQVWNCHENKHDGSELRDAQTGQIIHQIFSNKDVGRCLAADIDPRHPGLEMWSSASGGLLDSRGKVINPKARIPINFAIWWDGDLQREMLDHETVSKYNYLSPSDLPLPQPDGKSDVPIFSPQPDDCTPLLRMEGCAFNNGTKSNPCLAADLVGDWREEVLTRTEDNRHLRLYVSPLPTPYRFHTFLADPVYRHSVTTQNVAYNQPTCVGFYFGAELLGSGRLFRGWQF